MEQEGFLRKYGWTTLVNLFSIAIILAAIPTTLFFTMQRQQKTTIQAEARPDLAILYIETEKENAEPLEGDLVKYYAKIKNIGTVKTGAFDYIFTIAGQKKDTQVIQNLNPQEEIIVEDSFYWIDQEFTIKIDVDSGNIIKEMLKENNTLEIYSLD